MSTEQHFIFHNNSYAYAESSFAEPIKSNFISTWTEVRQSFSTRTYHHVQGDVTVSADWKEAAKVVTGSLTESLDEDYYEELRKRDYDVPVEVVVTKPQSVKAGAHHFVDLYLYDFFLCLNLSAPGSCDFFSAYVSPRHNQIDRAHTESPFRMKLSASRLEYLWEADLKAGWGLLSRVPLQQVVNWLNSINVGTKQIASSRIERGIFAFLHLCQIDGSEPSDLVWLSHILEALYDTPKATITKSLQDRVCSVLSIPEEKQKSIRKQLREFYNVRSLFVHGEIAITHPLHNDFLDEEALSLQRYLIEHLDFGMATCIATFQKHITNSWQAISFSEIHRGIPT
jgi:hypothetical protein